MGGGNARVARHSDLAAQLAKTLARQVMQQSAQVPELMRREAFGF